MKGDSSGIDKLARDLATGSISRRAALRRLAAGALGIGLAAAPSALAEELERGNCPKNRRCGKKCCPKGAKCKNGKCKCKAGKTKCGKACADLTSDPDHCGTCDNTCDEGRACVDSQCEECSVDTECPDPGNECQAAVCVEGFCEVADLADGEPCSFGSCFAGQCTVVCGDEIVGPGEACDGSNLNGQTCQSQGFDGGTLACSNDCMSFDTSGCVI